MSWARQERFALSMKYQFFHKQTHQAGVVPMSWARQERPARSEKESEGSGGAARPLGKIAEQRQSIFKEIFIFSQTNTPGRSSSDELGEAGEVRPSNEILIFSQSQSHTYIHTH